MPAKLLSCDGLRIPSAEHVLSVDGFELHPGDIAHVFGTSDSGIQQTLRILGGVFGASTSTEPAPPGTLVRPIAKVPTDELRKVRFKGEPLYVMPAKSRAAAIGHISDTAELSILGRTVEEDYLHALFAAGVSADWMHTPNGLFCTVLVRFQRVPRTSFRPGNFNA